jgi:multiple sugar transport system substrate-binding protein
MRRNRYVALLFGCAALMAGVVGCGGDDDGGGGGGGGGAAAGSGANQTEGAKVIDPKSMQGAKGSVTYCTGKDTTGFLKTWVSAFSAKYPNITLKTVEFPPSADEQRNQFIQRQQAKSPECDIFSSDVIWTAEFASQKWLMDLTPYIESRKADFLAAPLETITFEDKIWGVPDTSDAAFLFVRTDKVKQKPATWQQAYQLAKANGGIVFQGAPYEGLTCDFLELAFAAGGEVLSEDGTKAVIDSPENVKALQTMVDAVQDGAAPKAVTTYMEPETITAWQTGDYAMMRNWTYAYAVSQDSPKVANKFEVQAFPPFEGAGRAAILGGHNAVISAFTDNPGAALQVVDYIGSEEHQIQNASEASLAPTLTAVYDNPKVKKALPYAAELKQTIEQARARPVSPVYPQISQAIYKNVNAALSGQTSPEDAMKQAQSDIEKALATF